MSASIKHGHQRAVRRMTGAHVAVMGSGLAGRLVRTERCNGFLLASSSVGFNRIGEGAEQEGCGRLLAIVVSHSSLAPRHSQLDQSLLRSRNTSFEMCWLEQI